jgi:DNA modification methylase
VTKTAPAPWRNRIVGTGDEAPDQLVANPANWRMHPGPQRDALRGSLAEVGWVQQVMVNRRTGFVVDGHARVEEALTRGEPTVPVLYVDLSPEEEALVLATLDPIGAMATRDDAKLQELLAGISIDDAGLLALLGDLAPLKPSAGLTDPDDVPDLEPSTIKAGDLFALGDHRLMCGDSATAGEVARLMDGARADCLWTDPPYGVAYVGKTKDALMMENDGWGADELVRAVFANALACVVDGAPFYCASPPGSRSFTFWRAIVDAGWQFHQEIVWVKDSMVLGHSDYHFQHEPILYGYAPGEGRSGRGKHAGTHWYGDNSQVSVLAFDRPKRSEEHPTMKPVALVAAMLANSTPQGGGILEPFSGSGTTIIAAEQLGRRAFAMEIDPRYVAVAIKRWEQFTGRTAEQV